MPSMLSRARQRAEDERLPVEWLEQDCRDIRSDRRFTLVFSATNAMQHLHDLDSVVAFLASIRRRYRSCIRAKPAPHSGQHACSEAARAVILAVAPAFRTS
ncbi:class I SAM-dependent methyltransferase [Streptomyces sp. NPDC020800]|uniref:class I SAM-dependent methyltransferase n=1 Tax=Streptomyces sp. NPDC020800 TaxID=3365092 RepID=UPI0037A06330